MGSMIYSHPNTALQTLLFTRLYCVECVCVRERDREREGFCLLVLISVCLLVTKPQRHQGDQMLFPPSLITSSYGLALFSCPLVNKPSCQTVLFHGISHSHGVKRLLYCSLPLT